MGWSFTMPKNTPYILVSHEAMPHYTSVPTPSSKPPVTLLFSTPLHSRELLLHFFHLYHCHDSVTTCMLHCRLFQASHLYSHPADIPPTSRQCSPVCIEIHHYCSPTRVGLTILMNRCQHQLTQRTCIHVHVHVYGHLIRHTTLTNGLWLAYVRPWLAYIRPPQTGQHSLPQYRSYP